MSQATEAETNEVVKAVTERFIRLGRSSSVKEIAEEAGFGETRVRRILAANNGCPTGITCKKEHRETKTARRPVWCYSPTLDHLAGMIVAMRIEADGRCPVCGSSTHAHDCR